MVLRSEEERLPNGTHNQEFKSFPCAILLVQFVPLTVPASLLVCCMLLPPHACSIHLGEGRSKSPRNIQALCPGPRLLENLPTVLYIHQDDLAVELGRLQFPYRLVLPL